MKEIFGGLSMVVGVLLLIFGLSFISYKMYEFFSPRYTAVDNKVFKESQQYNDGMVRDLENLKMEYINADVEHKDAIRAIVLHRFSVYPLDRMPPDLQSFYNQLQTGR
jgi:uncharacterized membrane protein